ncbi:MAG: DMT family transporter [Alphaproteobacteria bacterium]
MADGPRMGATEWLLLVTLSVLWGGSFFFAKVALAALPPMTLVLGRTGIAAATLVLVLHVAGYRFRGGMRAWCAYLVMGTLNNAVPFTLLAWSQTEIASGLASILNSMTPLCTALLAHLFTRDERLTLGKLTGILVGLAGAIVMIGPELLAGLGVHVLAELAALAATVSYALAGLYGRRFKGDPPIVTAAGQLAASACLMLPAVLLVDRPWRLAAPGAAIWGALAGMALLSTALAYILYFRILARAGATNVLLVTFLIPVTALLLGVLVLGERLEPGEIAGMLLIFAGLALIDGRLLRLRERVRSPDARRGEQAAQVADGST